MGLGNSLRRVGSASPLLPALVYAAALLVSNVGIALAPRSVAMAALGLLLWAGAALFLFVVVTWYRDDDWLAAGFLIGITGLLSAGGANVIADTIATRSLGAAILSTPGLLLATLIRGVVVVPLCGGVVALARWITRRVRPASVAASAGAPPA